MTPSSRFRQAMARVDAVNTEDPNAELEDGVERPKELLYAERMTAWLERLEPKASEALRLAVRAQHIRRWEIPRGRYDEGRRGYLRWRTALAKFHAETAGAILRDVGYDDVTVERVQSLLRKEGLKHDPEAQTLEDVACLVFLEHHLADFAARHHRDKVLRVLGKTWNKMSSRGREVALTLDLSPATGRLVADALERLGERSRPG